MENNELGEHNVLDREAIESQYPALKGLQVLVLDDQLHKIRTILNLGESTSKGDELPGHDFLRVVKGQIAGSGKEVEFAWGAVPEEYQFDVNFFKEIWVDNYFSDYGLGSLTEEIVNYLLGKGFTGKIILNSSDPKDQVWILKRSLGEERYSELVAAGRIVESSATHGMDSFVKSTEEVVDGSEGQAVSVMQDEINDATKTVL